jgi:hypothetical protein
VKSIRIVTAFTFAALPVAMYVGGCSSSTTTTSFDDGGSSSGVQHPDGSTSSSGSSSGSGSGSSSGSGSGSSSGSGSGSSSGDGGSGACPAPVSGSLPPYMTVKQALNSCTSTQISAFVMDCASMQASQQACQAWQQDMNNQTCKGCLIGNPPGTGALLFDSQMNPIALNVPGCIAIKDPTNGPTCAQALEPDIQCDFAACGGCANSMFDTCVNNVEGTGGACATYGSQANNSCATDFADAGVANTACADPTSIINAICGTGM